jgi:hypothetical protein
MMLQKPVHGLAFRSLRSRLVVGQRSALSFTPNPDIHTTLENDSSTSMSTFDVSASRLGLDPASNRFHAPIVNHENYSFSDWPENHTFPVRINVLNSTEQNCTGQCRGSILYILMRQAYTTASNVDCCFLTRLFSLAHTLIISFHPTLTCARTFTPNSTNK